MGSLNWIDYGVISLPFAVVWQVTLFLLPMQLIIRSWLAFFVTLVTFAISLTGLYLFWYKKLTATNYEEEYENTVLGVSKNETQQT